MKEFYETLNPKVLHYKILLIRKILFKGVNLPKQINI